ncbi:hypothetical protein NDU88_013199 [Pleurodeles waltl]|uniref:Uncharacterized protein n=1 Tax=Pleurodeles waltl TaxID=8319 RepID=A0AAV7R4Y7_PLEWA|nr:hypothetical protein NDU88_013199 [Pleurodeles waltl]
MLSTPERRRRGARGALLLGGAAALALLYLCLPATAAQEARSPPRAARYSLQNWAIILICLAVVAGVMLILLCAFAVTYCVVLSRKGWIDFRAYFTHMAP